MTSEREDILKAIAQEEDLIAKITEEREKAICRIRALKGIKCWGISTTATLFRHSRMLLKPAPVRLKPGGIQVFQDNENTKVTGCRLEPCRNDGLMV